MPSAAPAQPTATNNSNSHMPSDSHAPSSNASSASQSTAAPTAVSTPGAAQSHWRGGSALFDLKMNPFIVPDQSATASSDFVLPVEAKVPAASLNPYRDGRIRTAVPSKLKGKTNKKQGNFSVMQMHVEKPQMTERDLAAKRTSERTAAAARLASTQGYRHPRRPRPPPSTVAPPPAPPPQPRLNPPLGVPGISRLLAEPTPLVSAVSDEKLSDKQPAGKEAVQEIDIEHTTDPFTETDGVHEINTEQTDASFGAEVAHENNHVHADDSFTGADTMQDISLERPNEALSPANAPRETNIEETASLKPPPRTLAPRDIKAEQTRLLQLFQKLRPAAVVDRLCLALTQFGGVPGAPPPQDGRFPESASVNGSGDLFISWVSEVFPPAVIKSTTIKRPPKPPTGRPRGRPKGSTKRLLQAGTRIMNTAFVPLAITSEGTDNMQLPSIDKDSGAVQQSVTIGPGPGPETPLPCAPDNQSLDTPPSRIANGRSSTTVAHPTAPRLMDFPAAVRATSNRPLAMAPIVSTGSVRPVIPGTSITPMARRKKSTGRPRGRPKGSKNKPRSRLNEPSSSFRVPNAIRNEPKPQPDTPTTEGQPSSSSKSTPIWSSATEPGRALRPILPFPELPNASDAANSIMQRVTYGSPHSTHENRPEPDSGNTVPSQRSQSPKSHDQDNSQISTKKRKDSQQGPPADARIIDTHQAPPMDAPPAISHTQVQQAKRRCVSPDSKPRDLAISGIDPQPARTEAAASPSVTTAARLLSASSSFGTHIQRIIVQESSNQQVQPGPSHPYQQHRDLKPQHFDGGQQHRGNQYGQLQRQQQLKQFPLPSLDSVHSNQSSNMPSPSATRRVSGAPGQVPLEVTVVDLYQRQQHQRHQRHQRQRANQSDQSAGGSSSQAIGSNSPVEIRGFGEQPPLSQREQQAHLYPANAAHAESHARSEEPAPMASTSQVHSAGDQAYIGMDYPISSDVVAQFESASRLSPTLTEPDMRNRMYHTMGRE
ncbi:hypothetical protein F53441_5940 [Fusarium austroafricanum]|uniref:Uncharacterized protein n=1 Tax=Fusarium austroafricanum TaxID=2364996 RepID=A0A8H4KIX5_9HYPO|nr:hypothetical protein F53441_5940 [Fusarium austroafricanum]